MPRLELRFRGDGRLAAGEQSFSKLLRHLIGGKFDHLDRTDRVAIDLDPALGVDLNVSRRHLDLTFRAHDRMSQIRDQPSLAIERENAVAGIPHPVRSLDLKKPVGLNGHVERIAGDADPSRLEGGSHTVRFGKHAFGRAGRSG